MNGNATFVAHYPYASNDGTVIMVGLADQQYDTREYVLLQRTLSPSKDDVETSCDSVHLTINDESHSAYGALERIAVRADVIELFLVYKIADELEMPRNITVRLGTRNLNSNFIDSLKLLCNGFVQLQMVS